MLKFASKSDKPGQWPVLECSNRCCVMSNCKCYMVFHGVTWCYMMSNCKSEEMLIRSVDLKSASPGIRLNNKFNFGGLLF